MTNPLTFLKRPETKYYLQLGYKTIVERYNKTLSTEFHFSIRNDIDRMCLQYEIDSINVFKFTNGSASNIHGAIIQDNYSDEEIEGIACSDDNKFDSIWFDMKKAIHSALDYPAGLGHRDIGYIGPNESPGVRV